MAAVYIRLLIESPITETPSTGSRNRTHSVRFWRPTRRLDCYPCIRKTPDSNRKGLFTRDCFRGSLLTIRLSSLRTYCGSKPARWCFDIVNRITCIVSTDERNRFGWTYKLDGARNSINIKTKLCSNGTQILQCNNYFVGLSTKRC
jgi:hypothetical protein